MIVEYEIIYHVIEFTYSDIVYMYWQVGLSDQFIQAAQIFDLEIKMRLRGVVIICGTMWVVI